MEALQEAHISMQVENAFDDARDVRKRKLLSHGIAMEAIKSETNRKKTKKHVHFCEVVDVCKYLCKDEYSRPAIWWDSNDYHQFKSNYVLEVSLNNILNKKCRIIRKFSRFKCIEL